MRTCGGPRRGRRCYAGSRLDSCRFGAVPSRGDSPRARSRPSPSGRRLCATCSPRRRRRRSWCGRCGGNSWSGRLRRARLSPTYRRFAPTPLCSSRISQPCGTRPTGSFASTAGGSRRAATPRSSATTRVWLAGWSERVDNLDRTRTKRRRCWTVGLYPGSWSRLTSNGRSWSRQRRATRGTSRTGRLGSACSVTTPCLTAYGAPQWRRPTSPLRSGFRI
mmetsp:Transcript_6434/g.29008  ORF Transcript_6434/g.29008 Transcript_6434/m.29008 type:complete len:220 (+) Transcript_6434:2035-2694(+)